MKRLPLSKNKESLVDDADFSLLSAHKWTATLNTGKWYAVRCQKDGTRVYLHREVAKAPKGLSVDHINGDVLDNRRANLRVCSHAKNLQNQKMRTSNTSGITGVTFHKQAGKWLAQIKLNYKNKSLGLFSTIEEAAAARRAYEKQIGWFNSQPNL